LTKYGERVGDGDPVAEHRFAAETVADASAAPAEVLRALSVLGHVREDLDRLERNLIGAAREQRTGWPEIAAALGLASRQAAEQRWLRLRGGASRDPGRVRAARREQRSVDERQGLSELRAAAAEAYRRIEADREWDGRHRRAGLVRSSLATALEAPPGALYALCRNVVDDLEVMSAIRLPPALAATAHELRLAVARASRT
jgi:hypothetical protein